MWHQVATAAMLQEYIGKTISRSVSDQKSLPFEGEVVQEDVRPDILLGLLKQLPHLLVQPESDPRLQHRPQLDLLAGKH